MPTRKQQADAASSPANTSRRKIGTEGAAGNLPQPTGEVRDQICNLYKDQLRPALDHIARCLAKGAGVSGKPGYDQACDDYAKTIGKLVVALDTAYATYCDQGAR